MDNFKIMCEKIENISETERVLLADGIINNIKDKLISHGLSFKFIDGQFIFLRKDEKKQGMAIVSDHFNDLINSNIK